MTPSQWRLFRYAHILSFIVDFEEARKRAAASLHGGTYYFDDAKTERGWFDTKSMGMTARCDMDAPPVVVLPWSVVAEWVAGLSGAVRKEAAELLRREREETRRFAPYFYKGRIPHDHGETDPAVLAEWRKDYDKQIAETDRLNDEHRVRARAIRADIATFVDALAPVEQVDLFGVAI